MKARNRADQILEKLRQKGSVSLAELIAALGASPASVRRDLAKLEEKGLVRRTHGGAMLVEPLLYEPFRYDSPVPESRAASHRGEAQDRACRC
jgi:DeoR family transcriptional regulator, aga operon transcriptional repressor